MDKGKKSPPKKTTANQNLQKIQNNQGYMQDLQKQKPRKTFFEDFLLGGVSAAISKTLTAPLQFVKRSIMGLNFLKSLGQNLQMSTSQYMLNHIRQEGLRVVWTYHFRNMVMYCPLQALNFSLNEYFRGCLESNGCSWVFRDFLAGGLAGAVSLLFTYPLYYTSKAGRIAQLSRPFIERYKGFGISCLGIFIYRAFYFGIFNSLRPVLPDNLKNNLPANFVLGWASAAVAGIASLPLDNIRIHLMFYAEQNVRAIDSAAQIFAKGGLLYFFKGYSQIFLGFAVTGGLTLSIYDQLQMLIGNQYSNYRE